MRSTGKLHRQFWDASKVPKPSLPKFRYGFRTRRSYTLLESVTWHFFLGLTLRSGWERLAVAPLVSAFWMVSTTIRAGKEFGISSPSSKWALKVFPVVPPLCCWLTLGTRVPAVVVVFKHEMIRWTWVNQSPDQGSTNRYWNLENPQIDGTRASINSPTHS